MPTTPEGIDLHKEASRDIGKALAIKDEHHILQLIGPTEGDATKELMEKRKRYGVNEAYVVFKERVKKGRDESY